MPVKNTMAVVVSLERVYAYGMAGFNTKKQIRDAFSDAQKRVSVTIIGEEIDVKPERLYTFGSKGVLNYEDTRRLEIWLIDKGFLGSEGAHTAIASEDAEPYSIKDDKLQKMFVELGSSLEAFALELRKSDIGPALKAERLHFELGRLGRFAKKHFGKSLENLL